MTQTDIAAGFILAGGRSSRMGRDKATLPFAGQSLIATAVGILQQAGLKPAIAGDRADLAMFAPIVADLLPGQGPLGGVCAALEGMEGRWGVFLPVDVPMLPPSLLVYLLRQAQTTGAVVNLASVGGLAQTFPAVLDRTVLPVLRSELEAGRRKCFLAFEEAALAQGQHLAIAPVELAVHAGEIIHPAGLDPVHWFLNLNTLDDLRSAQSLPGHPIA